MIQRLDWKLYSSALLALFAMIIDIVVAKDTVLNSIGISSTFILGFFVLILWLIRQADYKIPETITIINNWLVLPISLTLAVVFSFIHSLETFNSLHIISGIYFPNFGILALGSITILLLTTKLSWSSLRGKYALLSVPLLLVIVFVLMDGWPNHFFLDLNREDHLIEWTQVWVLLISVYFAYALFEKLKAQKYKIHTIIFLFIALGLFIVAGEEISWGQRLLRIETPEIIAEHNLQDEITIHNLEPIADYIWHGYLIVTLYGSFAWVIKSWLKRRFPQHNLLFELYIPPWYTSLFFALPLVYHIQARPTIEYHSIGQWSETMELYLYLGIVLFLWQLNNKYLKILDYIHE